jgi:hypothetical protein
MKKVTISFYMCPYACPTEWNNMAPTGQVLMKSDIWTFLENQLIKFRFHLKLTRTRQETNV